MGGGRFEEAAVAYGMDSIRDGRGMAVSDFDGDGDLDIVLTTYGAQAHYFVNNSSRGHWLQIDLVGIESNRDAVGAIVRIATGDRRQMRVVSAGDAYASQFSHRVHFGLGDAEQIDELEILWPSGLRQRLTDLGANRRIRIVEGEEVIQ